MSRAFTGLSGHCLHLQDTRPRVSVLSGPLWGQDEAVV